MPSYCGRHCPYLVAPPLSRFFEEGRSLSAKKGDIVGNAGVISFFLTTDEWNMDELIVSFVFGWIKVISILIIRHTNHKCFA